MEWDDVHSTSEVSGGVSDLLNSGRPEAAVYHPGYVQLQDRDLNEMIRDFRDSCQGLERQLETFASSVRQLGSSLGLYKGARELQQQLLGVRRLLEDETQIEPLFNRIPPSLNKAAETPHYSSETWVHKDLGRLVNAVSVFSQAWDDFPEFVADNERRHCLADLEQHLLVWLNILGPYEYSPAFLRCVRELLFDTNMELGHVTRRLSDFVDTGVHEIRFAQKHTTRIFVNSATIATFFSAVTVSTIQYSFADATSLLQIAVNTLWFSSLVLSVSSAINSLLAMTWRQAIYSTPERRVPWWVRIWFKQTPIILLSMSVLSFLAGLLCFVFLTQNRITRVVVSTLMAIVTIGLGAISVWFAWEKWVFSRLRRKLWLQEAHEKLENTWGMFLYEHFVWKPMSASLPTRSAPRPPLSSRPSSLESPITIDGSFQGVQHHGLARLGAASTPLGYSDAIFPELVLHRMLMVGKNEDIDQHVRHVLFSPKGNWFAACTRSICYIYRVEPQIIMHQALVHQFGKIRQLAWSPDESWLLMHVSGGIELWEVGQDKFKKRHKEWIGKTITKIQWSSSSSFLVLTDDSLSQFKIGDRDLIRDRALAFDTEIYTFAIVPPGDCVLVVAGHRSRAHEEIRFPRRIIRAVTSYHIRTGKLLYSFPLLRDVHWINVSSDGVGILMGFGGQQASELWSFESGEGRISFKHQFTSSGLGKERFSGCPHFVGPRDEFVACATTSGSIQIWKRDENRLVSSIVPIPTSMNSLQDPRKPSAVPITHMTWNPGAAMFASSAGAEAQIWAARRGE